MSANKKKAVRYVCLSFCLFLLSLLILSFTHTKTDLFRTSSLSVVRVPDTWSSLPGQSKHGAWCDLIALGPHQRSPLLCLSFVSHFIISPSPLPLHDVLYFRTVAFSRSIFLFRPLPSLFFLSPIFNLLSRCYSHVPHASLSFDLSHPNDPQHARSSEPELSSFLFFSPPSFLSWSQPSFLPIPFTSFLRTQYIYFWRKSKAILFPHSLLKLQTFNILLSSLPPSLPSALPFSFGSVALLNVKHILFSSS